MDTADFGEDWTSTLAANSSQAFAVDDDQRWLAMPFSSWNEELRRYANGVQLLSRAPHLRREHAELASGWIERVLFLKGRLVAVSSAGLTVIDPERMSFETERLLPQEGTR
jgi:hypothetical protein